MPILPLPTCRGTTPAEANTCKGESELSCTGNRKPIRMQEANSSAPVLRVRLPPTGVRILNSWGKEGCKVEKNPFPLILEKGVLSPELPISPDGQTRKIGVFGLKGSFIKVRGNGFFHPETLFSPGIEDSDPCRGSADSQHLFLLRFYHCRRNHYM